MIFGNGRYVLSYLNLENGESVLINKLSKDRQRELLNRPSGNNVYTTKAVLLRIHYEVNDFIDEFNSLYSLFAKKIHTEQKQIPIVTIESEDHVVINLDTFDALIGSGIYPDRLFSVELIHNSVTVGYLFFLNKQISIFSTQNIIISGEKNIITLFVNSLKSVKVQSKLIIENDLTIYSKNFDCTSPSEDPLIQAKSINIVTFQQATINAIIKIKQQGLLKAGNITIYKDIECEYDNLTILSERVDIHSSMLTKKKLIILALDIKTHDPILDKKTSGAHLHANEIFLISASTASIAGTVSSCSLDIIGLHIDLLSTLYIQGNINLNVYGKEATIHAHKSAKIYFGNGSFRQNSTNCNWFDAHLHESPFLKVYWKNIVNPFELLTDDQLLFGRKYERYKKIFSNEKPACIQILPYIAPGKPRFYDEERFTKLTLTTPINFSNTIEFKAPHLDIQGRMTTATMQVSLHGDQLYFSGHFEDTNLFGPPALLMKAKKLDLRDSHISTSASVSVASEQKLDINSHISADQLNMTAKQINFTNKNTLSSNRIIIKADEQIQIPKTCQVKLSSPQPVLIQCRNLKHNGILQFDKLLIKAEESVRILSASMRGNQLTIESRYLIGALSSFVIKDHFSVTSAASLLGLCRITSDYYTNTSFINLSCSLYTPATLRLSVKSGIGLCMAAANTAISILHFVLHDPVSQGALIIARLSLNAIPALINAVQLANDIHKTAQGPQDQITLIKMANQVKVLVSSLASLGYSLGISIPQVDHSFLHDGLFTPPNWDNVLTTLNRINDTATPLMAMAQPGKQVSSLFNISFDANLGTLAVTDSSLVSAGGSLINLSMISTQSSLASFNLNPVSYSLTPGYTANSGLYSYSVANDSILPIGSHTKRYIQIDSQALVPVQQHQVSIDACRFNVWGKQSYIDSTLNSCEIKSSDLTFNNGSLNADIYNNNGKIKISHSSVKIDQYNSNKHTEFQVIQSELQSDQVFNNSGTVFVTQSNVKLNKVEAISDSLTLITASNVKADKIDIEKNGGMQVIQTNLKINSEMSVDGLFAADAGSHVQGDRLHFSKTSQIGSRTTDWDVRQLDSDVNFDLEIDTEAKYINKDGLVSKNQHLTHDRSFSETRTLKKHDSKHSNDPIQNKEFKYQSSNQLNHSFRNGVLVYESPEDISLHNRNIISLLPLDVVATTEVISGHNSSNVNIGLTGSDSVTFDHAQNLFSGLDVNANKVTMIGGDSEIGQAVCLQGKQFESKNGAKIAAGGNISLSFTDDIIIEGNKTVNKQENIHHGIFSKTKEITVTTTFKNATVESAANIEMQAGQSIQLTSADILAAGDLSFNAKNIQHDGLLGEQIHIKNHSDLIHSHNQDNRDDIESVCHIAGKNLIFHATDDITVHGSDLVADKVNISSNTITASTSILTSRHNESVSGLTVQLPNKIDLPAIDAIQQLAQSTNSSDTISGAISVASDLVNKTSGILDNISKKDPVGGIIQLTGLNPELTLSLGKKTMHSSTEKTGEGYISTKDLNLMATNKITFLNNYAIDSTGVSQIKTPSISSSAAGLHSSFQSDNTQLMLKTGLVSSDLGISRSHEQIDTEYWQGSGMHFNQLDLNAKTFDLYGQQIKVNQLTGRVDILHSESSINTFNSSGYSGTIFYHGGFSFSKEHAHSRTIDSINPFTTESASISTATHSFIVGSLYLKGQSGAGLQADYSQQSNILIYNVNNSFSVSGAWCDLISPAKSTISSSQVVFSLLNYKTSHDNYLAFQGKTLQVLRNSCKEFNLSLPIYHASAGVKFVDNLRSITTSLFSHSITTSSTSSNESKQITPITNQKSKTDATFEVDFSDAYEIKQSNGLLAYSDNNNSSSRYTRFFSRELTTYQPDKNEPEIETEIDIDFIELGKDAAHTAKLLEGGRYNLMNSSLLNSDSFMELYSKNCERIISRSSGVCHSLLNYDYFSNYIFNNQDFVQMPIQSILKNSPFSLSKINLLKYGSYGLFGLTAGMDAYAIWTAENHYSEIAHIGFMTVAGAAGWELGSTVAGSVCLASGPICTIGLAFTGLISVNIISDFDWNVLKSKIGDNIRQDRYSNIRLPSVLPMSIFNFSRREESSLSENLVSQVYKDFR